MPRAKKDYLCLNVKIDVEICHKLTEVSTEAGQTKTMVVDAPYRPILLITMPNSGFCARQRPGSLFLWER